MNVFRVQQKLIGPNEQLHEIVQKFWNLESEGVSKNKFDVCENFVADISFENSRYEVKLSFKSEHGMLDDKKKKYWMASLEKTQIYLNVAMKLLRIKSKAHKSHIL